MTNIEPPEPQTADDIRTLEQIKWAPRGCDLTITETVSECDKPSRYRFKALSPYGKTTTEYACSTEHAVADAQNLWAIGYTIQ